MSQWLGHGRSVYVFHICSISFWLTGVSSKELSDKEERQREKRKGAGGRGGVRV